MFSGESKVVVIAKPNINAVAQSPFDDAARMPPCTTFY